MRSWLAALSLANLLLIRIWVELLGEQTDRPPAIWYTAAIVNLLLITGVIWVIVRVGGALGRCGLAAVGAVLFAKELSLAIGHSDTPWKAKMAEFIETGLRQGWLIPLGAVALVAFGWLAWRKQARSIAPVFIMLSPIILVTAGQAVWRAVQPPSVSAVASHTSKVSPAQNPDRRVLWIIFDELDERVAFSQRPAGFTLPSLDAFRAESVVFRHAGSISNSTSVSVPAMLGNLFAQTHQSAYRTGVAGWFLPYCETYGTNLTSCQEWRMNRQMNSYGTSLFSATRDQLRSLFESSLYSLFGQSLAIQAHIRTAIEMERAAALLAAQPDLNLVFLHLPTPHTPFIFDAKQKDFSARNQDARGYLGNLQLADRMFARIRAKLTASGLWQKTHVLITGDHGFRQGASLGYPGNDLHVPLMWKPAGFVKPRNIEQRFETAGIAPIITRLLDGETAESVLAGYP